MQSDTSIIMGFRPPQIDNPLAVASQAEGVKSARMKNALAQQEMDRMQSPEYQEEQSRQSGVQKQKDAIEAIKTALPALTPDNWNQFGSFMEKHFGDAGAFGQPYNPEVHEKMMGNFGIKKPESEARPMNDLDKARADYLRYQMGGGRGGNQEPIMASDGKGGFVQVDKPQQPQAKLSSAAEKELFDATDRINKGSEVIDTLKQALALNDKSYSGAAALQRAQGISGYTPIDSEEADNTIMLDNLVRGQALANLKLVFGGNPTEGERAMLLELQASANKTPSQRKSILERAIKMADSKMAYDRNKAEALTTGRYRDVDYIQQIGSNPKEGAQPTGKVMPFQVLQKAAQDKFGGDIDAAIQAAIQNGYTIGQ